MGAGKRGPAEMRLLCRDYPATSILCHPGHDGEGPFLNATSERVSDADYSIDRG